MWQIKVLRQTMVYGGIIAVGGALYFSSRIQDNFKSQEYYTLSMELLRGYPPASKMLGEPIRAKNIELGDYNRNRTDGLDAQLCIPVKGSKDKGVLHLWASRNDASQSWIIDKLDLELHGRQQWTFYINPKSRDKVQPYTLEGMKDSAKISSAVQSTVEESKADSKAFSKQKGESTMSSQSVKQKQEQSC